MRRLLHLATIAAALAAGEAHAASVFLQTSNANQVSNSGYGAAFGTVTDGLQNSFANASAFEFRGGVAVSTFATANGTLYGGGAQGFADAGTTDSFRAGLIGATEENGIVGFRLVVPILATGSMSISTSTNPNRDDAYRFSYAAATYSYSWNVGGVSGFYQKIMSRFYEGSTTNYESDPLPPETISVFVPLNQFVAINFAAHAEATASANGFAPANASADYGHTLKWGGVTSFTPVDANGNAVALPQGVQLTLLSADGQFDYMNAAANPYVNPVPEPGQWAMIAAGLGIVGWTARRRKRQS